MEHGWAGLNRLKKFIQIVTGGPVENPKRHINFYISFYLLFYRFQEAANWRNREEDKYKKTKKKISW